MRCLSQARSWWATSVRKMCRRRNGALQNTCPHSRAEGRARSDDATHQLRIRWVHMVEWGAGPPHPCKTLSFLYLTLFGSLWEVLYSETALFVLISTTILISSGC